MTSLKKRAHFLGFVQHGVNSHATDMWRNPTDKIGYRTAYAGKTLRENLLSD